MFKKTLLASAVMLTLPTFVLANDIMTGPAEYDFKNVGNQLIELEDSTLIEVPLNPQSAGIHASVTEAGEKSNVTMIGKDISINLNSENIWQAGIDAFGGANLTLGTSESRMDSVTISGSGKTWVMGAIQAWRGHSGNEQENGGHVFVNTKNLDINIKSPSAIGIYVWNNTTPDNLGDKERSSVEVNADKISIVVEGDKTSENYRVSRAIQAWSQGIVRLNANEIYISADELINTRGDSIVEINGKKTQLKGDINFAFSAPDSGTPVNSTININLSGNDSSWVGNTFVSWNGTPTSTDEYLSVTGMSLSLENGASWTPTKIVNDSTTQEAGKKYTALNNLSISDGVVNLTGSDIDVTVENMTGSGTVNLAVAGGKAGKFIVDSATDASLDVNLMDADLKKELSSDEINAEQAKALLKNVGYDENGKPIVETKTEVKEGMVNSGFGVNSKGETTTASANTLMQASLELTSAAPLALNRIMMNDVRKRLGDIRTSNGTHGAWARYDGGKLSGDGGLENDFHTIQVGIDTVPTADAPRMGVAFSYTDSDAEYARGSADMKAYSLAMYSTWMGDNGQFFDLIGRMGTADTDMVVDGQHKGSMDNVALSMSGEFGWRFDVTDSIYVEPQVEATYTYVNEDSLSLSTANYDVDAVHSLLGRIGFAAGMKCPSDFGNVYVRASAVHEFLGDSKITGVNAGNTNVYEIDGKDTWFEYGIGANFNITKSTYMWADVERTTGGALDEDWRATVGVRYAW